MKQISRREFTQGTVGALAAGPVFIRNLRSADRMPLAFSTLGCPGWEWKQILDVAAQSKDTDNWMRG